MRCRIVAISGFHLLDVIEIPPSLTMSKISPDIIKCPLGRGLSKIDPG